MDAFIEYIGQMARSHSDGLDGEVPKASAQGSDYSCTLLRHSRGMEPESIPADEGMPDEDAEEKARCDATNNVARVGLNWRKLAASIDFQRRQQECTKTALPVVSEGDCGCHSRQ